MSKVHVKQDDTVYILRGKDAGKNGKVLAVYPDSQRVIVEGVNIITKHKKPTQQMQKGGIVKQEGAISSSNVMLVCPKCKRPSKTGRKFNEAGEKVRFCKACGEVIDRISRKK